MKRIGIAIVVLLPLLITGVAFATPPDRPCQHGSSEQECRPDPNDHGEDCEEHGQNDPGQQDHCAPNSEPTPLPSSSESASEPDPSPTPSESLGQSPEPEPTQPEPTEEPTITPEPGPGDSPELDSDRAPEPVREVQRKRLAKTGPEGVLGFFVAGIWLLTIGLYFRRKSD